MGHWSRPREHMTLNPERDPITVGSSDCSEAAMRYSLTGEDQYKWSHSEVKVEPRPETFMRRCVQPLAM